MKTFVLVALLFTSAFASSLFGAKDFSPKNIGKRDVNAALTCNAFSYNCASTGGSCSNGCPDCNAAFQACQANITDLAGACTCLTNYVNCYAAAKDATCPSGVVRDACMAAVANCSCGTAYTGQVSYNQCATDAYCADNGKCMTLKAVGAACNSSEECGDSSANPIYTNSYVCKNNKCARAYMNLPGDSCSSNSDCEFYSSYNLGCVSGVCASQQVGSTCPSTSYTSFLCGPGLYCDDSLTCQKSVAIGASCDGNSTATNMCGQTGGCDAKTSMCVKYLTKTSGQACSFDGECATGLYCSKNTSTCKSDLSAIACTSNQDCTNANPDYLGCSCNSNGKSMCVAPSVNTGCDDTQLTYLQCAQDNGCYADDTMPNGCLANKCKEEYDCYIACQLKYYQSMEGDGYVCTSNYSNSCNSPSSATQNVVAMAVVGAASAAAILL